MIYATDLDRTIIFSSKFLPVSQDKITCVEYKNEKEISYMQIEALDLLNDLMSLKGLYIVPITTRSLEQFQRVTPFQKCEYAIVSNGGIILHNGSIFKPWQNIVKKMLQMSQKCDNIIFESLESFKEYFSSEVRKVDDIFFFVKLKEDKEKIEELLKYLGEVLEGTPWNYTLQGLKLYIIPKEITKEKALTFLKDYLDEKFVITSGDGKLDKEFIVMGNQVFIPEGSEVLDYIGDYTGYNLVSKGFKGTVELFKEVRKIYYNWG